MKSKISILIIIAALLISGWAPMPASWTSQVENTSAQAAATNLKIVINNKTGETISLSLKGAANYNWTVKPGKSTFDLAPGKYKYSYKACNGQKNGTVEVKKNGQVLTLAACKAKGASGGGTVGVVIQNDTGGYIRINLTGPATYSFSLGAGKSTINVIKGKYTYTVWGCGGASLSGVKQLKGKITWTFWCY